VKVVDAAAVAAEWRVPSGAASVFDRVKAGLGGDGVAPVLDDEDDASILAIRRLPDGERWRPYKETVVGLKESEWDRWPIAGPRTLLWCLRFIAEHDQHPKARHVRWRQAAGLSESDAGVSEHEAIMRTIELALLYDQLHLTEIAAFELLARRAQMIELKYKNKIVPVGSYQNDPFDDAHLYQGTAATRGLIMVSPQLEQYVSGELAKEAGAAKERRKLREERALTKPPPGR
jgi:hypothetical protein